MRTEGWSSEGAGNRDRYSHKALLRCCPVVGSDGVARLSKALLLLVKRVTSVVSGLSKCQASLAASDIAVKSASYEVISVSPPR